MGKVARPAVAVTWLLALLSLTGCAVSGNGLVFFPADQRLLDTTKAIRIDTSETLPLPRELDRAVLPAYFVEPSDVLLVQPADLDSPVRLPADQPILPDGTINLGRYGRLLVAGKTVEQIAAAVHDTIESQEKANDRKTKVGPFLVRLVVRASKVYYVLGEVNSPGSFPLSGRETVLDGIIAAGGLNQRASQSQIVLSRPTRPDNCRIVLPICYRQIVQLGDTTTNYQLLPGDRIFVPTRDSHEDGGCCLSRKKACLATCCRPEIPCAEPAVCTQFVLSPTYHVLGTPVALPAPDPAEPLPFPPTPVSSIPKEIPADVTAKTIVPVMLPAELPDARPVAVPAAQVELPEKLPAPPDATNANVDVWHRHQDDAWETR